MLLLYCCSSSWLFFAAHNMWCNVQRKINFLFLDLHKTNEMLYWSALLCIFHIFIGFVVVIVAVERHIWINTGTTKCNHMLLYAYFCLSGTIFKVFFFSISVIFHRPSSYSEKIEFFFPSSESKNKILFLDSEFISNFLYRILHVNSLILCDVLSFSSQFDK